MSTCRLARTQFVTLEQKQGWRRAGGDGRLQRTVSTKQPSDCLIRDRKRLLPRSPSAATFQKKQQQKKSQQRRAGPRLNGHLLGKPSLRNNRRLHFAAVNGGGATNKSKCCCAFLASLLIGSGLHRMKLARKLLAARAFLVLAANSWV